MSRTQNSYRAYGARKAVQRRYQAIGDDAPEDVVVNPKTGNPVSVAQAVRLGSDTNDFWARRRASDTMLARGSHVPTDKEAAQRTRDMLSREYNDLLAAKASASKQTSPDGKPVDTASYDKRISEIRDQATRMGTGAKYLLFDKNTAAGNGDKTPAAGNGDKTPAAGSGDKTPETKPVNKPVAPTIYEPQHSISADGNRVVVTKGNSSILYSNKDGTNLADRELKDARIKKPALSVGPAGEAPAAPDSVPATPPVLRPKQVTIPAISSGSAGVGTSVRVPEAVPEGISGGPSQGVDATSFDSLSAGILDNVLETFGRPGYTISAPTPVPVQPTGPSLRAESRLEPPAPETLGSSYLRSAKSRLAFEGDWRVPPEMEDSAYLRSVGERLAFTGSWRGPTVSDITSAASSWYQGTLEEGRKVAAARDQEDWDQYMRSHPWDPRVRQTNGSVQ